jgi:hypothetical protein|nr:anti-sigma factor [Kofleriaceae bacterium]
MKTHVMMHPRAEELLVESALRELTADERAELVGLGVGEAEIAEMDRAAAALAVATAGGAGARSSSGAAGYGDDVPAAVMERLMASVEAVEMRPSVQKMRTLGGVVMPGTVGTVPAAGAGASASSAQIAPIPSLADARAARAHKAEARRRFSPAWLVAAASLVLAAGTWWWARDQVAVGGAGGVVGSPVASLAAARSSLVSAPGTQTIAWTATADRAAKGTTGDVVWSPGQQQGYMRFVGLAANDPASWQYQLWIFDRTRDQAYPVDGGVFDVSSTGEIIVPISAKIHVDDATLFAVTVERPGGVVVSKRERIVVTAKAS